jgi:ribose transport system ATP-binding protein
VLLHDMGLDIDPRTPVRQLSVGRQQIVEIAKAMSSAPAVLLLDEPTSALAAREVGQLFALIRRLRERGVTMIYITHRLSELFEIADTCTVLRDGGKVGSIDMGEATTEAIVEMMFGSVARAHRPPRRRTKATDPVLEVENLTRAGAFENISFTLRRGEVLGLAGMLGAGRTEVLRAIFGADNADSGRIVFDGAQVDRPLPKGMKHRGLGYTPENRKEAGLVQILSVHQNLCMASLAKIAPRGFITQAHERPYVGRQIAGLSIKAADPHLPVSALSGGNQQKIVIGNWLNTGPKVMFFDEPSRGIDVEAKQQIFEIIWAEAARGVSAIFVSVELEEVLEVCDRILVLRHGRIVAEVRPEETTLTELYRLCMEGAS